MDLTHSVWKLGGAIFAVAMLAGCNQRDSDSLTSDAQNLARDAGHAAGSVKLAASVNTVLMLRKNVDLSGIHVDSKEGTVTLSGEVPDEAHHKLLVDTVNGVKGVDKVVDELKVAGSSHDSKSSSSK